MNVVGMDINAKTRVLASIGHPIGHSLSPLMHNAAFQRMGLNFVFLAFDVTNLKAALGSMRSLDFLGYSVTMPHKQGAMKYLDRIDPLAAKIQAVNTVVNRNGMLVGYNTDSPAAIKALKDKAEIRGKKIVLVGAGGAARAIALGLQQEGAETTILDTVFQKAKSLAKAAGCGYLAIEKLGTLGPDILINATPVGMFPNVRETPVPKKMLREGMVVFDIVYNPLETLLLKNAKESGCLTVSGAEMFVEQGALQFELWTGEKAPRQLMHDVVIGELSK